jgi:peptidoglycan-associated lipoprotein
MMNRLGNKIVGANFCSKSIRNETDIRRQRRADILVRSNPPTLNLYISGFRKWAKPAAGHHKHNHKMKLTSFINILAFGLILTVASACKHQHPPVTPLPNGGLTGQPPEPGTGGKMQPGGTTGDNTGGIPQGPGHQGWIENPDQFKSDTVYFDFDSSSVKPGEKSKISAVADYLKSNSAAAVRVEGNCDERGTEEYNRSLGERRALAVREELVTLGVDPNRVDTTSYGKDRPSDSGHDESSWKKNRRDEFILLTPPK